MKPWSFDQIRRVTLSRWLAKSQRSFSGRVSTDSRNIGEGDLFVAIRGEKFDGHAFIPQAVAAGAAAVLVDDEPSQDALVAAGQAGTAVMRCDVSVRGLNRLATAYRREIRARVVAVGGSNGKTTTKRIMHTVLSGKLSGHASPKSFNNNIGLPLTILEVQPQHEFVILEVGTNASGEIAALGHVAMPDIAVITSIGLEHLEFLGDLKSIAAEEASLARFIRDGGMLFIPNNSLELKEALKFSRIPRVTVGLSDTGADMEARGIVETMDGLDFEINGRLPVHVPLLGRHNVWNILLAIAVARRLGLSDEEIIQGLAECKPAPMRMEPLHIDQHYVIHDAYNANPSSMTCALETFGSLNLPRSGGSIRRRVAILADMLELGTAAAAMHQAAGDAVVDNKVDIFMAVGPNMAIAAQAARARGVQTHYFTSTAEAKRQVPMLLAADDAILLKGSRRMHLEDVLDAIRSACSARSETLQKATPYPVIG